MAKPLLEERLWQHLEPLIPVEPRRFCHPGRQRLPDRGCLTGIVFVLRSGIPWEMWPREIGCGSGMTCWRRLRRWQAAGMWQGLHRLLLNHLRGADQIHWSRALVDSSSVHALGGGQHPGPNPTDRRTPGSKHPLITDAAGVPLAFTLSGANANDVTQLLPWMAAIASLGGQMGRSMHRPLRVQGDRACGSRHDCLALRRWGIRLIAARPGDPHGSGLSTLRWPVKRPLSWLPQFRRLRLRTDLRSDIRQAFLSLAWALTCHQSLNPGSLC